MSRLRGYAMSNQVAADGPQKGDNVAVSLSLSPSKNGDEYRHASGPQLSAASLTAPVA